MRYLHLAAAFAAVSALAACGGGGDSSASAPPPPPPAPGQITLTGVVARGAALDGASVVVQCANGTGTATTSSTGAYTVTITGGSLPCVLQATAADNSLTLHSVAPGTVSTASAVANITTLTELLVAQLTGQVPSTFMSSVTAAQIGTLVTAPNVTGAQAGVISTLTAAGIDTSALTNLVSGDLVAATGGTGGNGYDQVLDALAAALTAANSTLADLTATVADTAAGSQPGTGAAPVAEANPLPADLLLRPHASNCTALRSGNYRLIKFAASTGSDTTPNTAVEDFSFDASNLTATFSPSDSLSFVPNGTCRYTLPEGEAVVSPSGVIVLRHQIGSDDDTVGAGDRNAVRMMIALPRQDLALADLAGNYAVLGVDRNPIHAYGGYVSVATDGVVSGFRCWGDDEDLSTPEASCAAAPNYSERVTKNSNGSFSWASAPGDPDPFADAMHVYRAGNGELLMVIVTPDGAPNFAVKRRTLGLPAVNDTSAIWNVMLDGNLVAAPLSETSHVITNVDAGSSTVTRNSSENGGTPVAQTLVYNSARAGYFTRLATSGVRPFQGLPLYGFGLTAIYLPNTLSSPANNARFILSVRQ